MIRYAQICQQSMHQSWWGRQVVVCHDEHIAFDQNYGRYIYT